MLNGTRWPPRIASAPPLNLLVGFLLEKNFTEKVSKDKDSGFQKHTVQKTLQKHMPKQKFDTICCIFAKDQDH